MTIFDKAYFDSNYRSYPLQSQPVKLDFYIRNILRWAPAKPELELLEVGCGLGSFLAHLSARGAGFKLSATDISEYAVQETRRRAPQARVQQASADETPFPKESFDCICSFDVCEHVPNLNGVYEAIYSMLRPGGIFVVVVPVYDGLSGPIIRLLDKDPTHIHKEGRNFWLRWGSQRMELLDWVGAVRFLLPWGYYLHFTTRLGRRHTPAILAVFRK